MSYQAGEMIDKCGKPDGIQASPSIISNQSTLLVGRAYCGGPLLETLSSNWAGTCALVQLAIIFTLAFRSPAHATTPRKRRDIGIDISASHRGSLGPPFLY
jgi:hypothetical protein